MLNKMQNEKLKILYRKKRTLESNKEMVLRNLLPILNDLEKIRIEIDSIELENKYGD